MQDIETHEEHTYRILHFLLYFFFCQPLIMITLNELLPYLLPYLGMFQPAFGVFEDPPQDLDNNNQGSTERSSESSIISDQTQPSRGNETANMHSSNTSQRLTDNREAGDQANRPVQFEELHVRRLRSGRVYDQPPSQQNAGRSAIKHKTPTPTTGLPRKSNQRCLKNWFGDNYRIEREERVPEDIERYGRSLSYVLKAFNLLQNTPVTQD